MLVLAVVFATSTAHDKRDAHHVFAKLSKQTKESLPARQEDRITGSCGSYLSHVGAPRLHLATLPHLELKFGRYCNLQN